MSVNLKPGFLIAFIALAVVLISCNRQSGSRNYYFDSCNGNDFNDGLTPETAFKSLSKIQGLKIEGGDSILLKSGCIFTEKLFYSGKGDENMPVVIGKYGGDAKPHIKGNGAHSEMVHIFNAENITVRDLEISNKADSEVYGLRGLKVELDNYGNARNTIIGNLFIHNVTGGLEIAKGGGSAVYIENAKQNDTVPSRFINLIVENCLIKDCTRDGIRMSGQWIRGKWNPNKGVVIRRNVIDGVPGDGIVVVGCDSALVEFNTLKNFPEILPPSEACDGIWPWSSDNTLVQFNDVSGHKSIVDGYAYDSDWNCRNTVFQFNLSHSNYGGFMLVIATDGWPADWCVNGNVNTIIRYNISINDGLRTYKTENRYFSPVIHLTGLTKNTIIENNIFCIFPKPTPQTDRTLLHFTMHDGRFGEGDVFRNNFISATEPTVFAKEEGSVNNHYSDNFYTGPLIAPAVGFVQYKGKFGKHMWYNAADKNWDILLGFVKNKTVKFEDREILVTDIIGYIE